MTSSFTWLPAKPERRRRESWGKAWRGWAKASKENQKKKTNYNTAGALLRLFPSLTPTRDRTDSWTPTTPLSMTNRTLKTSSSKILQQYPYRSPTTLLSISHVTLYPHRLHYQLHLPMRPSLYHRLLTHRAYSLDSDWYDTDSRYSRPFPGLDLYISVASMTVKP